MADPLASIKTILENDWTSGNTDSLTPTVDFVVNHKLVNLANGDFILLYESGEQHTSFGLGGVDWTKAQTVSIDIRTTYKTAAITAVRAHAVKLRNEVERILKANITGDANYQQILPLRTQDLSDKNQGLGRFVIDCELKYWGT